MRFSRYQLPYFEHNTLYMYLCIFELQVKNKHKIQLWALSWAVFELLYFSDKFDVAT